ncbi:TonB-dependent receptor plug domain-containing protein [Rheinheimera sp.]|uniref:TonB-dependent receptor plug domain-containing protein n=1 Tax=Rheinheimera sp. TaxID=1869214 RepID=UPI002FDE310B
MHQLQRIFPVFSLCLFAGTAIAQDSTDLFELSLEELAEVSVVTAGKYQQDLSSAAAVMTVLDASRIRNLGAENLQQLLQQVSSFYMTGSHFFPRNVASIRGNLLTHADNHVLLLLNGRPLRESYSGGINFAIYNAFPLQAIERLEIIRGPGSVLYGSNAYVGVINLVTAKQIAPELQLGVGEQGQHSAGLAGHLQQQDWVLNVAAKLQQDDGWPFASYDNNRQWRQIDYGQQNLGLFASASYQQWQLDWNFARSQQDFFGAATNWSGGIAPDEREVDSSRQHIALQHQWQQQEHSWLQSSLSWARMDFSHYNYDAYANDLLLELDQHWQASPNWKWQGGIARWWQNFGTKAGLAAAPVPDTDNRRDTAYLQADWQLLHNFSLSSGVQFNRSQRSGSDWLPRFGLVWQLTEQWGLKLLQARAYRDPYAVETDFNIVLRNAAGQITGGLRGNPALLAEQIDSTDLQWFFQNSQLNLAMTLFHSEARDLISRQRAADRVIDFVNQGQMQLKGIELEAQQQWAEHVRFSTAVTYQQNKVNQITDFTTVPNWLAKSSVELALPGAYGNLTLLWSYTGTATDIAVRNPNRLLLNPPADAYHSLDLHWRLPFTAIAALPERAELRFYVANLLDEDIYQPEFVGQTINTIPAAAGRRVRLSLHLPL